MKRLILICALCLMASGVAFADEKETLQWKAKALVAEANVIVLRIGEKNLIDLQKAQVAIEEFKKELNTKGYMVDKDNNIIEKPKSVTPGGEK